MIIIQLGNPKIKITDRFCAGKEKGAFPSFLKERKSRKTNNEMPSY
jgi:hypothetical protein